MWTVAVAEKEPFAVFHVLQRALGDNGRYQLIQLGDVPEQPDRADVLLVVGEQAPETQCQVAVISGESAAMPAAAECVTYGLSQRDTLTISSTVDRDMALALQREIVDVRGRRTDRQEILLKRPTHLGLEQTLACAGSLLVLGVDAEEIPALIAQ